MAKIAGLLIRLGADTKVLVRDLRRAEYALRGSARRMSRTGSELTKTLSVPIAALGALAIKSATEFETSFTKINTLVGISGDQLTQLRDGIDKLSGPLATSKKDLSDALFVITSAGSRGQQALDVLEASAKASAIGLGETKDIARAATAVLTAYADSGLTASDAIDKFTAVVRAGNLEASELAPTLGKLLPIAQAAGVSFDEVGANIATFTRLGVNSAEAVTALKSLLSGIVNPSEKAKKELKRLGLTTDDLRASIGQNGLAATLSDLVKKYNGNTEGLAKLFPNVEALSNALGTAGAQGKDYIDIVEQISKSNGLVNKGFETVSETAGFKMKQALQELNKVSTQFGDTLLPIVVDLLGAVKPLLGAFNQLDDGTKTVIAGTALLVAAIGPAIRIMGAYKLVYAGLIGNVRKLIPLLAAARTGFLSLSLGPQVAIVAALTVGIGFLIGKVVDLTSRSKEAAGAQRTLEKAQVAVAEATGREQEETDKLFKTIKDVNSSSKDKAVAIETLNRKYPAYIGNIDLATSSLKDLNTIQSKINDQILQNAASQELQAARAESASKRIQKQLEIERIKREGLNALGFFERNNDDPLRINGRGRNESAEDFAIRAAIEAREADVKSLNEELKITEQLFKSAFDIERVRANRGRGIGGTSLSQDPVEDNAAGSNDGQVVRTNTVLSDQIGLLELLQTKYGRIGETFKLAYRRSVAGALAAQEGNVALLGSLRPIELGTSQLTQQFGKFGEKVGTIPNTVANAFDRLDQRVKQSRKSAIDYISTIDQAAIQLQNFNNALTSTIQNGLAGAAEGIAGALGEVAAGSATMADVGRAALAGLADILGNVGKLAISTGIAVLGIRSALQSLNPVAAIAAGTALVALSSLVKSKLSQSATPFANGGIVYGPTLGLVGEYRGAASNPEVIAPLDRLQAIIGAGNSNDQSGFVAETRISGSDLVLAIERQNNTNRRRRGR